MKHLTAYLMKSTLLPVQRDHVPLTEEASLNGSYSLWADVISA